MNKQKHQLYMAQILSLIFKDKDLCNVLAFKGGTALMFFHGLTRFSTDLDFNLLDAGKADMVYNKIRSILTRFGTIDDEAKKLFGPVLVLDYGKGERMLKVEISTRTYDNHYEMRTLAGIDVRVLTVPDMFAHKLCAMGERLSPRDVFDVWFFLQKHVDVNEHIVISRTGKTVAEYSEWCARRVREASSKLLMQGLGEVIDNSRTKNFVKTKLIEETAQALELFATFPQIAAVEPTHCTMLLETHPKFVEMLKVNNIDVSTLDDRIISDVLENGHTLTVRNRKGDMIEVNNRS